MPTSPYELLASHLESEARAIRAMGQADAAASAALPIPRALTPMCDMERLQTEAALKASPSITAAAKSLGVSRRTLHRHINEWGLTPPRARHRAPIVPNVLVTA